MPHPELDAIEKESVYHIGVCLTNYPRPSVIGKGAPVLCAPPQKIPEDEGPTTLAAVRGLTALPCANAGRSVLWPPRRWLHSRTFSACEEKPVASLPEPLFPRSKFSKPSTIWVGKGTESERKHYQPLKKPAPLW